MNKNKIIIYYSYTGHTKMIANMIQKSLGCDILELKPKIPYSTDYQTVVDEEEIAGNNNFREIEPIGIDLSKYDEIILGFPVWWYIPASPVRTFLKEYDLSGKTIIPYATNAGWLGQSFNEITKLCSKSQIKNELNVVFDTDYKKNKLKTSEEEIANWIKNL